MERRVIVTAALGHSMTHALELSFAALLVRIGLEFGADLALLGAVATAGTVTFGATALPAGWLSDRLGPRVVISGAMAAAALFAVLVAASPNLWLLAVSLSLLGAAIGLYHPPGTAMVATVAERRGLALATHGIAGNVGVAIAPALATAIGFAFGWRVAYLAFALLAAIVAIAVWRLAPTRREVVEAVASRARAQLERPPARRRSQPPRVRTWTSPWLLVAFFSSICQGFIYRGSLTFLPAHLERNLGISIFGWEPGAVAGAMAALVLSAAVFGQIAGGMLSDRIPVERALLPFVLFTAPFLALMAPTTGVLLLLASAGFVIANWAQQPIFNGLVADYAPDGGAGRAFGLVFFLTFGIGAFSASFAGWIAEARGTEAAFLALAVVGLLTLAALATLAVGAERRRREDARGEPSHVESAVAGGG